MNARWRLRPHDAIADPRAEPALGALAPGGAGPAQSRDRRSGPRSRVPGRPDGQPARPRAPARCGRGGRSGSSRRCDRAGRSSSTAITTWTAFAGPASSGPACGSPAAGDVDYYIPHRVEEGYGVNAEALRRLATENPTALIVTVDCGISAVREAELARELGVELIVTDHHTIGPELAAGGRHRPSAPARRAPIHAATSAGRAWRSSWPGRSARASATASVPRPTSATSWSGRWDWWRWRRSPTSCRSRTRTGSWSATGWRASPAEPSVGLRALHGGQRLPRQETADIRGRSASCCAPRINAAGRLERAMMAVEMLTTDDDVLARQIAAGARSLQRPGGRRSSGRSQDEARRDDRGRRRHRRSALRSSWPARAGIRESSASSPAGWPRSIIGPRSSWPWARPCARLGPVDRRLRPVRGDQGLLRAPARLSAATRPPPA